MKRYGFRCISNRKCIMCLWALILLAGTCVIVYSWNYVSELLCPHPVLYCKKYSDEISKPIRLREISAVDQDAWEDIGFYHEDYYNEKDAHNRLLVPYPMNAIKAENTVNGVRVREYNARYTYDSITVMMSVIPIGNATPMVTPRRIHESMALQEAILSQGCETAYYHYQLSKEAIDQLRWLSGCEYYKYSSDNVRAIIMRMYESSYRIYISVDSPEHDMLIIIYSNNMSIECQKKVFQFTVQLASEYIGMYL